MNDKKSPAFSTLKNASIVSLGTFVGQIVAFVGSLVLVRIYTPEQMGIFSTIVAISSFLSPLVSGRLSNAIPLPNNNRDAITLNKLAVIGASIGGIITGGGLLLLHLFAPGKDLLSSLWFWGLPALTISLAVYLGSNQLAVRFEQYFGLALRGVIYPTVMTFLQIGFGLLYFGADGLVLGMVLGHLVTAATIWIPISRSLEKNDLQYQSRRKLLQQYRHFPLILGPAGMVNSLAMQLPQIGFTLLFGFAVSGQFGMMMKILAVPITLLGQSVGFVYAGKIAKERRAGTFNVINLFDRLSLVLSSVAVVFAVGVFFLAEPVFTWLLGEEWRQAGQFATLFILSNAAQLVASPLSQTLMIAEKANMQLVLDILRTVSLVGAFFYVYLMNLDLLNGMAAVGAVSAAGYLLLWLVNRSASKNIL